MFTKPTFLGALAAIFIGLAVTCHAYFVFTGGPVNGIITNAYEKLQQYVLDQSILKQYGLVNSSDESKAASTASLNRLLGAPVAENLSPTTAPGQTIDPAYDAAQRELATKVASTPSPLTDYLDWADKRRAADVAMTASMNNSIQANNGKPLDWAAHMKSATQFQAISNDRLALSMLEANAAAENRIKQKSATADLLEQQAAAERRAEAEARLGSP